MGYGLHSQGTVLIGNRFSLYHPVQDISGELKHKAVPSHPVVVLLMCFTNCEVEMLDRFTSHFVPAYRKDENNLM
jgi:hypothetical protein